MAKPKGIGVLYLDDETIAVFDAALAAAEVELQTLLPHMTPSEIAQRFAGHVDCHLETELRGAKKYDNDCASFCEAVNAGEEPAF